MRYKTMIILLLIGLIITSMSIQVLSEKNTNPAPVHRQLDFDEDTSDWVYEEPDTAIGDSYRLWEHHGGYWADAEKGPGNDGEGNPPPVNPGEEDDLLCWAATCANMLEWTGWGFTGGMETGDTDDFFSYYQDHTTDKGSLIEYGLIWWFNGTLHCHNPADWSSEDVQGADFWTPPYLWLNYVRISWNNTDILNKIENWLTTGYPVGLSIYPINPPGGHAITCWGYNYNSSATLPNDYYLGVWVTDSDSHKYQTDPDDVIRYYEVEYEDHGTIDTSDDYWYMPNYGYGWKISGVTTLKPFPGEDRPIADAGGPYTADEGSLFTLDGSGTTDDDSSLRYRWDINDDGIWETNWMLPMTTKQSWQDDYTGTLRLEVFDNRLRDTDIVSIKINNVPPTITPSATNVEENNQSILSVNLSDPSDNDTFTTMIDWGDGTSEGPITHPAGTTQITKHHQYLDDNPSGTTVDTYTISVTVTDDDGGSDTQTTQILVENIDPTIHVVSPNGDEKWHGTTEISWMITDQGTQDDFQSELFYSSNNGINWEYIDKVTSIQGKNTYTWDTTTYTESDEAMIKIIVTDDDNGSTADTSNSTFILDNTPPITIKEINGSTYGPDDLFVSIPNIFYFNGYDTLSGIKQSYYRYWHNDQWYPIQGNGNGINNDYLIYNDGFSLIQDGTYIIEFYSEDQAGNTEPLQNQTHIIYDWWPMYQHDIRNTGNSGYTISDTSEILWEHSFTAPIKSSPAVGYDGKLYVGCQNGFIYGIDAMTGQILWDEDTGLPIVSSPAVYNGSVYVGSNTGDLYSYDYETGVVNWQYHTSLPIHSSPVVHNDLVFIGSDNLYALNATDGTMRWMIDLGSPIISSPSVTDTVLIVASMNGEITALHTDDGSIHWVYETTAPIESSPVIYEDKVLVGCNDGDIYCLDKDTGDLLWTAMTYGAILSSPALYEDSIIVSSGDTKLYRFNLSNGSMIWSNFIGPFTSSSPAIAEDLIVVGSTNGKIYVINADNGSIHWSYQTGGGIHGSPAIFNGCVYIGSNDKTLYCFGNESALDDIADPIADAGGPYFANPGEQVYFDGTQSIDADEAGHSIVQYDWKFHTDDSWHKDLGPSPTYTYNQTGSYTVTLNVTDDEGSSVNATTTVFITNTNLPEVVMDDVTLFSGDTGYGMLRAKQMLVDIGSCQVTITWDPQMFAVNRVDNSDFQSIFSSIDNSTGSLTMIGFCNAITGNFTIGRIEFTAIGNNNDTCPLCISTSDFLTADPSPDHVSHKTYDGVGSIFGTPPPHIGDVNGDGICNSGDIRYLALYLAGDPDFTPLYDLGDMNNDGSINSGDIRYLALYLTGNPLYSPLYP